MNLEVAQSLRLDFDRLTAFTHECRDDMHEPDEQGIYAEIYGEDFDNAMGNELDTGELVVALSNEGGDEECFNLATLIALARMAVLPDRGAQRAAVFGKKKFTSTEPFLR
jgi:hypothetical protein